MRRTIQKHGPDPVDVHVGKQVRSIRIMRGFSQEKLGNAVGLTFQQIQKYEKGANRISASMMWKLSHVLDIPITYFFEGLDAAAQGGSIEFSRQALIVVRCFNSIKDSSLRQGVFNLLKALAKEKGD